MMDTKTLVIGQKVRMFSGCYGCEGKVVKVTPEGVEVQSTFDKYYPLHFDSNGKGRDDEGTYECGRWHIDGMPFAEHAALDEMEKKQQYQNLLPFLVWWKSAAYEQRLALVMKWYDFLSKHRCQRSPSAETIAKIPDISSNLWLASVLESYRQS